MATSRVTVLLIGPLLYSSPAGRASELEMPLPVSGIGMVVQLPPAMGHSKRLRVPLAAPTLVGLNDSLMLQLLMAVLVQVSKSSAKGGLMPPPEAPMMS